MLHSVLCCFNAVNRHPIAHPSGWGMRCLLLVQPLTDILPQFLQWCVQYHIILDESTARRELKSPRSLSGRSIHLTLVTKWSWSWSWMTYCHPLCAMSIGPPILRYSFSKFDHENPWSTSCVWSKVKVMFNLENSKVKVMVKVKPDGHIWGLGVLSMFAFRFVAIGPFLAEI